MSRNDLVNFKVFLKQGDNVEVRRLSIEADAVTNFVFLKEKLQSLFPILREADYRITWKDADGDEITVTSDEELIIALTEMKDGLKVLHIIINPRRLGGNDDGDVPCFVPKVICDGCEATITGLRYKCIQCPDFDLCLTCESQGLHPEHVMLRFSMNQYEMPRGTGKMLHNFFRGLRKSSHYTPKFHHKEKERRCKREAWNRQEQQKQMPPQDGDASKEGEAAAWEQLHQMAQPYVEALLQGLNAQGCGEGAEFIRNIASGIFGDQSNRNDSSNQQEEQPQEKQQEKSAAEKPMDVDPGVQQKDSEECVFIQMDKPSSSTAPTAPTPENPTHADPVIAEGLRQLREMGFSNHVVLIELLKKHEGNLPYVIRDLLNIPN